MDVPDVLRDLGSERREESAERSAARADVVLRGGGGSGQCALDTSRAGESWTYPVEAEREHAEALVTVRAAEDARDPCRVALGEAEDRDTREGRRDELQAYQFVSDSSSTMRARRAGERRTSGTHSQQKIAMKTYQKKRRRFFCAFSSLSRWRASNRLTVGTRLG